MKIYLSPQISGGLILYHTKLKRVFVSKYYLYVLIIRLFLPIMGHYLKEKQEKKEFFRSKLMNMGHIPFYSPIIREKWIRM